MFADESDRLSRRHPLFVSDGIQDDPLPILSPVSIIRACRDRKCRTSRLIQPLICGLLSGVRLRGIVLVLHGLRASIRGGWTQRSLNKNGRSSPSRLLPMSP